MAKIIKYEINDEEHQTVMMPPIPAPIKAGVHGGVLCVWAVVDEGLEATESVDIWIVETDGEFPDMRADARYLDSYD